MIITGIAHPPERLHERGPLPSPELIYLAKMALKEYEATHLVTSLEPGWDQALVKAAIELNIAFTVAIPFPGRDTALERESRLLYLDLLARAREVYRISECYNSTAWIDCHCWRVDQSGAVLALWEYEFSGETFKVMDYALKNDRQVINLWEDWFHLFNLRKKNSSLYTPRRSRGAQVFDGKRQN